MKSIGDGFSICDNVFDAKPIIVAIGPVVSFPSRRLLNTISKMAPFAVIAM